MEDFKYRNYSIKPLEIEDLLVGINPRDGWAQTFEVSRDDEKFNIRLVIGNLMLARISKSVEELLEIFQEGVKKAVDLFTRGEEEINDWNYFEYDYSGKWISTNERF